MRKRLLNWTTIVSCLWVCTVTAALFFGISASGAIAISLRVPVWQLGFAETLTIAAFLSGCIATRRFNGFFAPICMLTVCLLLLCATVWTTPFFWIYALLRLFMAFCSGLSMGQSLSLTQFGAENVPVGSGWTALAALLGVLMGTVAGEWAMFRYSWRLMYCIAGLLALPCCIAAWWHPFRLQPPDMQPELAETMRPNIYAARYLLLYALAGGLACGMLPKVLVDLTIRLGYGEMISGGSLQLMLLGTLLGLVVGAYQSGNWYAQPRKLIYFSGAATLIGALLLLPFAFAVTRTPAGWREFIIIALPLYGAAIFAAFPIAGIRALALRLMPNRPSAYMALYHGVWLFAIWVGLQTGGFLATQLGHRYVIGMMIGWDILAAATLLTVGWMIRAVE